jgi:hypothetical protein
MSKFGFDKMLRNMDQMKRDIPQQIGNMAVRHFVKSFDDQGFTDVGLVKWKEVKRRIIGTDAYKYPKKKDLERRSRSILVGKSGGTKSGAHAHLKAQVNTSLKRAVWPNIDFSISSKYANRHNQGLDGMPKRKFMGNSHVLAQAAKQKIDDSMRKVLSRK